MIDKKKLKITIDDYDNEKNILKKYYDELHEKQEKYQLQEQQVNLKWKNIEAILCKTPDMTLTYSYLELVRQLL